MFIKVNLPEFFKGAGLKNMDFLQVFGKVFFHQQLVSGVVLNN
jgi:hypothetical protein